MPDGGALNTVRLSDSARGVRAAVGLLAAGGLVAFPTETVYGLGADARNARAVAGVYAAKGRPAFNPLIVHVADRAAPRRSPRFRRGARLLAERFWPGPLTLVLPRRADAGLAEAATAGLATVALRVPAHPLAQRLLAAFGGPLVGPSANPSGRVSPTTCAHVLEGLAGRIAAVLDGGACPVGVEFDDRRLRRRRAAPPPPRRPPARGDRGRARRARSQTRAGGAVTAPGPARVALCPAVAVRLDAEAPGPDEVWLGFGPDRPARPQPLALRRPRRSRRQPLRPPARRRRARRRPAPRAIAVAPIPGAGLGLAINDRLSRAAAPRPR